MKMVNRSDVGKIRMVNEDRAWSQVINGLTVGIVADGMGGHKGGDMASEMAIDQIKQHLNRHLSAALFETNLEQCEVIVKEAIQQANEYIYQYATSHPAFEGMGTTLVTVIASHDKLLIAHIGDSRAYKFAHGEMDQLTEDHSLVNELLRNGQITSEEAADHPRKNILMRALGTDPEVEADLYCGAWQQNDILLICSDGLSGLVQEKEIKNIVGSEHHLDWKAEKLIQLALDAGGEDNVTVVLLFNEIEPEQEGWTD
ncbi:Stp1/IreP family PP2C-type Ser/Thr phosphatase [Longirhabdus pacifica]|uniref:Stp1/IreP family PP2C-type Ser/Thr phosphatase n=1 Tax=Longirhabdus pacifica TaxID=2305227 RepID=UPI001008B624|nr:Stp1/IreP family PP2C-type Ser/Thr phosphatase [Longirhabdus pacifica]